MKKLLFLLMVVLATETAMTSCSKDDADEGRGTRLVGTWVHVIRDSGSFSDSLVLEFAADGNFFSTTYELYRGEVTYTHIGKGTYEYSGGSEIVVTPTYSDGQNVENPESGRGEIKFLNDNAFVIYDNGVAGLTYYRYGTVNDYSTGK